MLPILSAINIGFSVKDRGLPILDNINLEIYANEFVVILGYNGSGKTTLLKILSGDKIPSCGRVLLDQLELNKISASDKAKDFLTLTQRPEDRLFEDLTLQENIILWESRFAKHQRLSCQRVLENATFGKKFLEKLSQPVATLSGGEKQTFLMALTLAHPPKLLFLDEHTSALDHKAADEIMSLTASLIVQKNITTIMITHVLEDAIKYGDRLIVLSEGKIVYNQRKDSNISISHLKKIM